MNLQRRIDDRLGRGVCTRRDLLVSFVFLVVHFSSPAEMEEQNKA